jgi:hypothetical protein
MASLLIVTNDLNGIFHFTKKLIYTLDLEKKQKLWLRERQEVPESEHPTIEATFVECLQFLVAIENDENARQNFDIFQRKVETLVETINSKKQQ